MLNKFYKLFSLCVIIAFISACSDNSQHSNKLFGPNTHHLSGVEQDSSIYVKSTDISKVSPQKTYGSNTHHLSGVEQDSSIYVKSTDILKVSPKKTYGSNTHHL